MTFLLALLEQVRTKVLDNARHVPRYTCVQTIDRAEYRARTLTWRDRLRLDVAVIDGRETFSWAGAQQFDTTDIRQLTSSGSTGSGDFAGFLGSIFGLEATQISPVDGGLFSFDVPEKASGYRYRSQDRGGDRVTPYHGTFLVDGGTADLKRLTVDADRFPDGEPVRLVRDVMDYHRVKIGDGDFLLPETSKMKVQFSNGKVSENETHYSDCRQYAGSATIRFDDADVTGGSGRLAVKAKVPSRLKVQLGLKEAIHSEIAAAGDPVTGLVVRDVKDHGVVVLKAGDTVQGRIVKLEQAMFPKPRWTVAFTFEGMSPRKDAFTFDVRGNLLLDSKFRSDWETR